MNQLQRVLLAIVIVVADWAIFFLPLTALFLAYVILSNPPWFRAFLERLDAPGPS